MFNVRMDDPAAHYGKNVYVDDPRGGYHHVTGTRLPLTIAEACGIDGEEALANARLIAAAPDLYMILQRVQWSGSVEIEDGEHIAACPWCEEPSDHGHLAGCALNAALAKAEGREVTT